MASTVFTLTYLVIAVVAWPIFGYALLRVLGDDPPESYDYVFASFFGAFAAAVWPVSLILYGGGRMIKRLHDNDVQDRERRG